VLAVAVELLRLREQVGIGPAAVEERHLVAAREGRLDRRATQEFRSAEHQQPHGWNAIRPQVVDF